MISTSPTDFELDARLAADCHLLGRMGCSRLLLMDNALIPWFILVPETTATELYQLEPQLQLSLLSNINSLSGFIQDHFSTHKLNIAAIGNQVRQLHVHVIGRYENDPYWPGVVWGAERGPAYSEDKVESLRRVLSGQLRSHFHAHLP